MNGARRSAAEDTAAVLVHAKQRGSPVMIPGAFEVRVSRGATSLPPASAEKAAVRPVRSIAASDRERVEHEREGGSAPNIWRRVLPEAS